MLATLTRERKFVVIRPYCGCVVGGEKKLGEIKLWGSWRTRGGGMRDGGARKENGVAGRTSRPESRVAFVFRILT